MAMCSDHYNIDYFFNNFKFIPKIILREIQF